MDPFATYVPAPLPAHSVGLALSGGGFRAAFFHIGLLARLAELDILRQVDAISTVSGGSIVGTLYYLHVKRLLEGKPDPTHAPGPEAVSRQDYVDIVQRIERDFLRSVQENLRVRTFTNLVKTLRMAVGEGYSTSDRMSELFDAYFYSPVRGSASGRIPMRDLHIIPAGDPHGSAFDPMKHNGGRFAKVPMLFINATSLNTGRRWLFTPSWMGEESFNEADNNTHLDGCYYDDAPEPKYQDLPVGVAVGASAAVPGIFPPLPFTDLYPGWTVQLVDGGVFDNQGVATLEDRACSIIIASDGSGQMTDHEHPSPAVVNSLTRTNDVLMDRIRDRQVGGMLERKRLKRGAVIHLRDGLRVRTVRPGKASDPGGPFQTIYGIASGIQRDLSLVRTDLDTFCDVEADALMANAYRIAERSIDAGGLGLTTAPLARAPWRFAWILTDLEKPESDIWIASILSAARFQFFRTVLIIPRVRVALAAIGLVAVVTVAAVAFMNRSEPVWATADLTPAQEWVRGLTWGGLIGSLVVLAASPFVGGFTRGKADWARFVGFGILGIVVWVIAWAHLLLVDPLFKRVGRRRST